MRKTSNGMLSPLKDRGRNLPPTLYRGWHGPDHSPPAAGMFDSDGRLWKGTSRVKNPAARRKANRLSWDKIVRERRRQHVLMARMPADVKAALEAQGVSG